MHTLINIVTTYYNATDACNMSTLFQSISKGCSNPNYYNYSRNYFIAHIFCIDVDNLHTKDYMGHTLCHRRQLGLLSYHLCGQDSVIQRCFRCIHVHCSWEILNVLTESWSADLYLARLLMHVVTVYPCHNVKPLNLYTPFVMHIL